MKSKEQSNIRSPREQQRERKEKASKMFNEQNMSLHMHSKF